MITIESQWLNPSLVLREWEKEVKETGVFFSFVETEGNRKLSLLLYSLSSISRSFHLEFCFLLIFFVLLVPVLRERSGLLFQEILKKWPPIDLNGICFLILFCCRQKRRDVTGRKRNSQKESCPKYREFSVSHGGISWSILFIIIIVMSKKERAQVVKLEDHVPMNSFLGDERGEREKEDCSNSTKTCTDTEWKPLSSRKRLMVMVMKDDDVSRSVTSSCAFESFFIW